MLGMWMVKDLYKPLQVECAPPTAVERVAEQMGADPKFAKTITQRESSY